MKKFIAFVMVGLVYVVIAMAASWANSSTALDKTLETIGIAPGSANTPSQHSGDIFLNKDGNGMKMIRPENRSKESDKKLLKGDLKQIQKFALIYPICPPPPPPPPTDPKA